jgi:hypothetical protein
LAGNFQIMLPSFIGWTLLTGWFTFKRLQGTSHSINHIFEMFVTSSIIPFLSLYWRLYGSWKFKVLLIP